MNWSKFTKRAILFVAVVATGFTAFLCFYPNSPLVVPLPLNAKASEVYQVARQLEPLHQTIGAVQPGDWLESHTEFGQTFAQYVSSRPIRLTEERNVLYVLPLGDFDEGGKRIVDLSAEFLSLYFCCEVKMLETLPIEGTIPSNARRVHPQQGMRQILSAYVLQDVLPPLLPDDGVALIAFSSADLYPADDWNFVFGQASLKSRVGVWSIFRNGNPNTEFETCLMRTLKTATHETGHMFSIRHCIAYECNMCGSNNRSESDRRPIQMCPECVAKVWWATQCDPVDRFQSLQAFFEKLRMKEPTEFYRSCVELLNQ